MNIACLVPDDPVYQDLLKRLAPFGIDCARVANETLLMRSLQRNQSDAVLVDAGWDVMLEQRIVSWADCQQAGHVPILMRLLDLAPPRVANALAAGIDDVVGRDTDIMELAARLSAAVRRHRGHASARSVSLAGFDVHRESQRVLDHGKPVELTGREFALCWLLFSNAGQCVTRQTISIAVWGVATDISDRTLEQHVHRLRRKLGLGTSRGVTLRAAYGRGYQLTVHECAAAAARPPVGRSREGVAVPAAISPRFMSSAASVRA